MKNLSSKTALLLLIVVSLLLIAANNLFFKGARVDLTEDRLFSISEGTGRLLQSLPADVEIRFYYSERDSEELGFLRDYARRVTELLREYELRSEGKLSVSLLDPGPFSKEDDEATSLGLQRITVGPGDPPVFFGLVAIGQHADGAGNEETINFLHPDREAYLEYDISKMVVKAARLDVPRIGMISTLQIAGGADAMSNRPALPWTSYTQLRQLYPIDNLGLDVDIVPADIDLLLLVHPKDLSERTLYAVDQYALAGGKILLFADVFAQADPMLSMADKLSVTGDAFNRQLAAWGVEIEQGKVLADSAHALRVGGNAGQRATPHLAVLGYGQDNFTAQDHPIFSQLNNIIFSSASVINPLSGAKSHFEPLLQSSAQSALLDSARLQNLSDPGQLLNGFEATGERYTVVAHVTGQASSAYPDGRPKPAADQIDTSPTTALPEHLETTSSDLNIFMVADTDLLNDPLWVRVNSFMGQSVADPFADNGDFFINAAESLLGSTELMNLRSRGTYTRPFHVVEQLEREAASRFQVKEQELQARLQQTEARLAELRQQQGTLQSGSLSEQQQQEVANFRIQQLDIRKELRAVQHQLGEDIEQLGGWVKLINIALMPILITMGIWFWKRRNRRSKSQVT